MVVLDAKLVVDSLFLLLVARGCDLYDHDHQVFCPYTYFVKYSRFTPEETHWDEFKFAYRESNLILRDSISAETGDSASGSAVVYSC